MAIKTTSWRPDTCTPPGCEVEYTWDDAVPESSRVHSMTRFISKCSLHQALGDGLAWSAITDENPRRNKFFARIVAAFPALTMSDGGGNTVVDPAKVIWSFDPASRTLNISLPTATASQKLSAQNWADTNLGPGKVLVS